MRKIVSRFFDVESFLLSSRLFVIVKVFCKVVYGTLFYEIFRLDCYSVPCHATKTQRKFVIPVSSFLPTRYSFSFSAKLRSQQNRPALHRICEATEHPAIRTRVIKPLSLACVRLCSSAQRNCRREFCYSYLHIQNIIYFLVSPSCVWSGFSTATKVKALCFSRHRLRCPLIYTLLVHRSDHNSPLQQQRE